MKDYSSYFFPKRRNLLMCLLFKKQKRCYNISTNVILECSTKPILEPTSDIREFSVWGQMSGLKLIPTFGKSRVLRQRKTETSSRTPTQRRLGVKIGETAFWVFNLQKASIKFMEAFLQPLALVNLTLPTILGRMYQFYLRYHCV